MGCVSISPRCMGRDRDGNVLIEPPIVEMIAEDGVLADTKLIAEPWDAAGLYQVGRFPFGRRWSEWNGRYRDDVRRFWRGDAGHGRRTGQPLLRQLRPVPGIGPAAAPFGQLRHLPRRLHALGPGQLQPEAQPRQRREQPRRQRRELQLELRHRRPDRGRQRPERAPPPGQELDRHAAAVAGRADAPGRRRVPAHAAGQQQRLVPGQRDRAGWTGTWPSAMPTSCASSAR